MGKGLHSELTTPARATMRQVRMPREAALARFDCPDGIRFGWGVSEVQTAFVTTTAAALPTDREDC